MILTLGIIVGFLILSLLCGFPWTVLYRLYWWIKERKKRI